MQRRRQSGFTLVELMVTLAVLVILATLAAPSFARFIEKSRLRGAADDVVNLIEIARSEAVKRQRDVDVAFGGTTSAWCVGANRAADPVVGQPAQTATSCNCTNASACLLEGQQSIVGPAANSGVTISSVSTEFVFGGQLGTLVPIDTAVGALTLTSSTGAFALQINVSALGQVSACVPSGKIFMSGYPSC